MSSVVNEVSLPPFQAQQEVAEWGAGRGGEKAALPSCGELAPACSGCNEHAQRVTEE